MRNIEISAQIILVDDIIYSSIYIHCNLNEIEQNKSLIEKNKSSYDLVAEAQESSEAEKAKLKLAAFSLASQMDLTKNLLEKIELSKVSNNTACMKL